MRVAIRLAALAACISTPLAAVAQVDEDQTGAWYMYFFDASGGRPWGFQGDVQYRNWDLGGDWSNCCSAGA